MRGSTAPAYGPVEELGILSPLASAGLAKADIHRCAALTGMEDPEQKARPCLLTRLPYGMKPERSLLAGLAAGERAVHGVFASAGLPGPDFRLRLVECGTAGIARPAGARPCSRPLCRAGRRIAEAVPQLPPSRVVKVETLSGFFDRA